MQRNTEETPINYARKFGLSCHRGHNIFSWAVKDEEDIINWRQRKYIPGRGYDMSKDIELYMFIQGTVN